jgi:centromeric protein E
VVPTQIADYVFGNNSQTIDIYNSLAKYIIDSALQGVNGTIFAYGQTSSGKTHTMKGGIDSPGIIPLAISEIFSFIQQVHEFASPLFSKFIRMYDVGNSTLEFAHADTGTRIFAACILPRNLQRRDT